MMPKPYLSKSINFLSKTVHLVLLRRLRQVNQSLDELQGLIDGYDRQADEENRSPFIPVQWNNGEEGLEEGDVEKGEVEGHG